VKTLYHRFAVCISLAFLLASCASAPNISLEKAKAGPISTVALLRITESQNFLVHNLSGLSALGGAIGGAIAGGAQADRAKQFADAYNAGSTKLSVSLVDDFQHEFLASGKQVLYTPDEFAKLKDKVDDYSHIRTDKDAILSVWFGPVGYVADGVIDAPYEPWMVVNVRLLQGKTHQILSQKTYTAGYRSKLDGAVFVPCATAYRFNTFEKLMADFAGSVRALSECQKAIVRQAVQDLT